MLLDGVEPTTCHLPPLAGTSNRSSVIGLPRLVAILIDHGIPIGWAPPWSFGMSDTSWGSAYPIPGLRFLCSPWRKVLSRGSLLARPKPPELPKSYHEVSCTRPASVGEEHTPRTPNQVHSSRADPCGQGPSAVAPFFPGVHTACARAETVS